METDNIANRIRQFMDNQQLSNSQFADACGIPRPNLSQLLSGRNKKVSDVLIGQIHKAYPMLSVLWLLFGEGEMLVNNIYGDGENEFSENHEDSNSEFLDMPDNCTETEFVSISPLETTEFHSENLKNPDNSSNQKKEAILNPLNRQFRGSQASVNKNKTDLPNAVELLKQLDNLKRNPRKVVQIMVYYDDSTFETFFPDSRR